MWEGLWKINLCVPLAPFTWVSQSSSLQGRIMPYREIFLALLKPGGKAQSSTVTYPRLLWCIQWVFCLHPSQGVLPVYSVSPTTFLHHLPPTPILGAEIQQGCPVDCRSCCCPPAFLFLHSFLHPIVLHILENTAWPQRVYGVKRHDFMSGWDIKKADVLPTSPNHFAYVFNVFPSFFLFFCLFRL